MFKKHGVKLTILAVVLLFAGAIYYANLAASQANVGVVIEPNIKGNPDGAVTLVEYSDFQCPACAAAVPVVNDLLEEYGEDVRFEYRHFPLVTINPLAIPAARAVEAAGQQGQFWPMHDLLFENQQTWSTAANPTTFFIAYAEELELDVATFRRHLDASVIEEHIQDQFGEARQQGFTGTPTFTLNGERMQFSTYDDFVAQVGAAVATANGETPESAEQSAAEPSSASDLGLEFGI
ncbi:disulfide bond formation protein DsbA [bacterium]|nr:disulfide bond formation protein DsbA [bacterium]|tara:strand:- start:2880 stop:3587 length:708 start_codon:yes stop_codon:yes gene_type:complete